MYFFTYKLRRDQRTVRIGKGSVDEKSDKAVSTYLRSRYTSIRWHRAVHTWHSTEAAAYKHERELIDTYQRATGELPQKNDRRGGGGPRVQPACRKVRADGSRCENGARAGNYGFCGVHR